ncbi:hypothetical protein [Mycolicibacterium sarraceniae]|nr:hypothetical protein [Mycolicibacterium sarraceniae]
MSSYDFQMRGAGRRLRGDTVHLLWYRRVVADLSRRMLDERTTVSAAVL